MQVEGDGWTFCYVDPEHDVELFSNETYGSAKSAAEWARRAYPDVPIVDAQGEDSEEDGDE